MKLCIFYGGVLQVVRCTVLEGEERPDATAAAMANDDEHLHLEGAHGVLDGGPDAGVLGLQVTNTKGAAVSVLDPLSCPAGGGRPGRGEIDGHFVSSATTVSVYVPCRSLGPGRRCCGR